MPDFSNEPHTEPDRYKQTRSDTPLKPNTPSRSADAGFSTTSELTAHAVHLRWISNQVEELHKAHGILLSLITGNLQPDIASLLQHSTEQLAIHTAQISQLHAIHGAQDHPPVSWPTLTANQAIVEWGKLATWIADILVPWYEVTRKQLPDCWPLHRPAVIELSWLYTIHQEAFTLNAATHHAADWHTRWRPSALQRIQEIIPQHGTIYCRPGEHLEIKIIANPTPFGCQPPAPCPNSVSRYQANNLPKESIGKTSTNEP